MSPSEAYAELELLVLGHTIHTVDDESGTIELTFRDPPRADEEISAWFSQVYGDAPD